MSTFKKSASLIGFLLLAGVTSGFTVPQPMHLSPTTSRQHSAAASSPLLSSVSNIMYATPEEQQETGTSNNNKNALRSLSPLKTLRATMRAATGISLTAMYVSAVGFTSGIVRETMTFAMSILPTWVRYFLQPFLILYYVPLYMLRNWTSPKKRRERSDLYAVMKDDFKRGLRAVDAAQEAGYWPIQVNDKGHMSVSPPPLIDDNEEEDEAVTEGVTE